MNGTLVSMSIYCPPPCTNSWCPSAPVKMTSTQILMASGLGAMR